MYRFCQGPFPNFNNTFNGAPYNDGSGCPFNEFTGFQIFAAESYTVSNVVAGSEYVLSACNGSGVGA